MNIPHSEDSEKGVLSSMMQLPGKIIPRCLDRINSQHFVSPVHRHLFNALGDLWKENKGIDLITFTQHVKDEKQGISPVYVTEVYNFVPSPDNVDYYLDILRSKHVSRELLRAGAAITTLAHKEDGREALADSQKLLNDIANDNAPSSPPRTLRQAVEEKMHRMENNELSVDLVPSGLSKLDKVSPIRRGDMVLLQAERKTGKSILALNIALNVGRSGHRVIIFSLEDREPKLVDRLFAADSQIPMYRHLCAGMNADEMAQSVKTVGTLSNTPITIRDDCYDLATICSESRECHTRHTLGLIVIDYAQLVRSHSKDDNRERAVANVSRTLRLLAMELNVPILLLSQVNESGRSRESRALEQDATAIWHLLHDQEEDGPNVRVLSIPAQRNGESGIRFSLTFRGEIARFDNYAPEKEAA